ncbi:hypothetical protein PAL_GLEAN10010890 [Pteropus alecto]|uniref:Uncharacterized protein n=1 Tax=Pteropus alecto TaxID=9402 RepID=L5KVY2_PTEAL|nr:hypothetical protein PAL_GLEAN10010890 [Pteropus alecto]
MRYSIHSKGFLWFLTCFRRDRYFVADGINTIQDTKRQQNTKNVLRLLLSHGSPYSWPYGYNSTDSPCTQETFPGEKEQGAEAPKATPSDVQLSLWVEDLETECSLEGSFTHSMSPHLDQTLDRAPAILERAVL